MAVEGRGFRWGFQADADLSTKQFYFVGYTGASKMDIITTSGTSKVAGIQQNKPSANHTSEVMLWGVSKIFLASALTAGDIIGASASGTAMKITSSIGGCAYFAKGQLLRGGAASAYGTVVLAAMPVLTP